MKDEPLLKGQVNPKIEFFISYRSCKMMKVSKRKYVEILNIY